MDVCEFSITRHCNELPGGTLREERARNERRGGNEKVRDTHQRGRRKFDMREEARGKGGGKTTGKQREETKREEAKDRGRMEKR